MNLETMQIPLIFVAFFIVASIILSFVYKFGMKEKSYEEALAEQRQSTQNLLGIKQKPKEKKSKKTTKKKDIEEKKSLPEKPEVKGILKQQEKQPDHHNHKQKQIKFNKIILSDEIDGGLVEPMKKEVEIIEPNKAQLKVHKKKEESPKKEKVVTKKEDSEIKITKKEEIHEDVKKENANVVVVENSKPDEKQEAPKEPQPSETKIKIQNKTKRDVEEKPNFTSKPPITNGYIQNQAKDKKKKKNELNSFQQLNAAHGTPGVGILLDMIHKVELSHQDIQILIDLLLNKQQDVRVNLSDWSEGKSDPIQKLKKQLAEKEKALADEQEVSAGVQLKLKEIRNEQLSERTALNQKIKLLEEQLQNQQLEVHACNSRYHTQSQQLQQAKVQLNDELKEIFNLKNELTELQMQRQQYEMHMAQEAAQLRAELQEFSNRNEQLMMEINHIQKAKMDNEATYAAQLGNMRQELMDKTRQLEELTMELKGKNDILYRQEGDLKTEIAQLNAVMQQQAEEIRKTEQGKEELIEELNNLKKQKNISSNIITQLKSEIEQLQQDKLQNEASMENNQVNETEILNLKNEMASMKNQLEENEKKFKNEVETKLKQLNSLQNELDEQKTKNNELRNKNYKIMEALNAAESRMKNGTLDEKHSEDKNAQIESQKKFLRRLLPEMSGLNEISSDKWEDECFNLVNNYLQSLKKTEDSNENLQAKVEHYKNVIKDTEGMLNKLQAHIDAEEISWKAQIKSKDLELEALKEKLERSQNLETINGSATTVEGQ